MGVIIRVPKSNDCATLIIYPSVLPELTCNVSVIYDVESGHDLFAVRVLISGKLKHTKLDRRLVNW